MFSFRFYKFISNFKFISEKIKIKLKSDKEFLKLKSEYLSYWNEIEKLQIEQDCIYNTLVNILDDRYWVDSDDAYIFI